MKYLLCCIVLCAGCRPIPKVMSPQTEERVCLGWREDGLEIRYECHVIVEDRKP